MKRITRDKLYIGVASLFSERSTCGRLNVGCVITKDGRIIASGYNGPPKAKIQVENSRCNCDLSQPCQRSIHAEANAIAYSARNGIALEGTTMYSTHSPCLKCSELIIQAGIIRVIYLEQFRDISGLQLLIDNKVETRKYAE